MPPDRPRADSRARARRALQLRTMCRTWQEIADAEGFKSASAASNAVNRLVRRQPPEDLATMRVYTAEGLRLVQSTLFEALAEAKRRKDPHTVVAVARALADVMDRHARLIGMHVPVAQQLDVNVHQSIGAVLERAEQDMTRAIESAPEILDAEIVEAS